MSMKLFAETMGHFFAFSENAIQHYTTFKASIQYLFTVFQCLQSLNSEKNLFPI